MKSAAASAAYKLIKEKHRSLFSTGVLRILAAIISVLCAGQDFHFLSDDAEIVERLLIALDGVAAESSAYRDEIARLAGG